MHMLSRFTAGVALLLALPTSLPAAASELVSIKTPRGVTQKFILMKPDQPKATVVLFAGGHGALNLQSAASMKWGDGNFLVRSRDIFLKHGFMVAVMDAPSDNAGGMTAQFRMGLDHALDVSAVVLHLRKVSPVPVWFVGTSMGTFSAAGGALGPAKVDGLVLTSTITRAKPDWKIAGSHKDGVASMPLGRVVVPTLILSHKKDGCDITPAADGAKLKRALSKSSRVEIILLEGGLPPQSDPCQAKSEHGFLGIEETAVKAIADFIVK
jgi:hypothetical protein